MKRYLVSKEAQVVLDILKNSGIRYKIEYTFPDLKGLKGVPFRYDFAIFKGDGSLLALIEYDSVLHFNPKNSLVKNFQHYAENDVKKNRYALTHNIPLYRIPYWDLKTLTNLQDLFRSKYRVRSLWHNYSLAAEKGYL